MGLYGVALEGGGAKGSYQVGAWKALHELGVEIGGVAGTSVGAINGALMLQDSLDQAIEIWSTVSPHQLFDIDHALIDRMRKLEKLPGNMAQLINYFQAAVQDRGIDTAPLKQLLHEHINEETIRKSKKDFGLVTVSLTERAPVEIFLEEIPQGKLVDYILASSSLPIFQSHIFDGKRYLDGGFYNNLPINMLISRGYKDIISIMIGGLGIHKKFKDEGINIIVIEPKESLGAVLEFSPVRAKTNINLGYFDTMRVFKGYKGRRYYLDSVPSEDYFARILTHLPKGDLDPILEQLKLPSGDLTLRSIFEKLLPLVAKTLKIHKEGTYSDIVIAIIERAARQQKVERFKVYAFYDFVGQLNPEAPASVNARTKLVRLLKKTELMPWALRENIFDMLAEMLIRIIQDESNLP